MKVVWKRIHAWLDENAPAGYGHLRPGASADAIQAAETAMGLKLPADIKASYRVHDGQGNEPGLIGGEGWCLLTLQEMVKWCRKWSKHAPRFCSCVPVAWGGAGDYIFLDLGSDAERPGASSSSAATPTPPIRLRRRSVLGWRTSPTNWRTRSWRTPRPTDASCTPTRSTSTEAVAVQQRHAEPLYGL